MNFFKETLKEVVKAINILKQKNGEFISVKKIRVINNIKSTNRSKINFYWRALDHLHKKGVIELITSKNPKVYKLKTSTNIVIEGVYP